jgi:2-polyprenyl-6-methoxyphenol hydroxylase-like FAD-dependent oxidoreductase
VLKTIVRRNHASVLISGASIAGPVLAYWLNHYGFDVTVLERASAVRSGGYPIDIRGTALDVVEHMGLLTAVQAAHIESRTLTFVDARGGVIGAIAPTDLAANEERDVELPRGALTTLFYDLTKNRNGLSRNSAVRYRFNDSIESLNDDSNGVEVRFKSGERGRYDVVVGADGMHSNTRKLVFGPEEPLRRDLGYTFNIFSMPNDLGLSKGAIIYSEPGRTAVLLAVRESPELFVMLAFAAEQSSPNVRLNAGEQIERTAHVFASGGWQVPRLLKAMRRADDLYFDTVSQIRMSSWSKGRVGLVGDAAFAPSFLSGQGTSLAIVGAYVLAGELASHEDPADAFVSYERIARPFIEANQDLALKGGPSLLLRTQKELDARNLWLASLANDDVPESQNDYVRDVHNSLRLPEYER